MVDASSYITTQIKQVFQLCKEQTQFQSHTIDPISENILHRFYMEGKSIDSAKDPIDAISEWNPTFMLLKYQDKNVCLYEGFGTTRLFHVESTPTTITNVQVEEEHKHRLRLILFPTEGIGFLQKSLMQEALTYKQLIYIVFTQSFPKSKEKEIVETTMVGIPERKSGMPTDCFGPYTELKLCPDVGPREKCEWKQEAGERILRDWFRPTVCLPDELDSDRLNVSLSLSASVKTITSPSLSQPLLSFHPSDGILSARTAKNNTLANGTTIPIPSSGGAVFTGGAVLT